MRRMPRVGGVIALLSLVACTEPADPLVGEFTIEGMLSSDIRPVTCDPPFPTPYCQDTVDINEALVGTLTIPGERSDGDPSRYEGVTVAIGPAMTPHFGQASLDHEIVFVSAKNPLSSSSAGPLITLEGTFAGDSIVGNARVGYGFSPGTWGSKTGAFVARRK